MIKASVRLSSFRALGILVCLGAVLGCSSDNNPKTYQVNGTVTKGGKAVEQAAIVFVPANGGGYPATAVTDAEGNYKLTTFNANDGAVPGDYKIKVSKFEYDDSSDMAEAQVFASSEEELEAYELDETPSAPPKSLLPAKYSNTETSGLTYTVTESDSTYNIELK